MAANRILVADDSHTSRDMLCQALQGRGYFVDVVSDGVAAINRLRREAYDFVITDLDMPSVDGFGLIRAIAEMPLDPGVVLVTARGERNLLAAQELATSYSINLLGCFEKPLETDLLIATLKAVARPRQNADGVTETLLSEGEFMRGLMSDGLSPVFQPRIRLSDGDVEVGECFARWRAPGGGLMGASAVLGQARQKGYMDVLTSRMLQLAMEVQGRWHAAGIRASVSVNISQENLRKEDFADVVSGLAADNDVPPELIRLEVNETDLSIGDRMPFETLSRLHMRGFGLVLDDFGTGYASLLQLERIPFTEMVLSRAFSTRAVEQKSARVVLKAAIDLAHGLNMKSTCEGIENQDQLDLVRDLGADMAQGFLIGAPMLQEAFVEWYAKQQFDSKILKVNKI